MAVDATVVLRLDPADVERIQAILTQQVEIIGLLNELLKRQPANADLIGPFLNDPAATIFHPRREPEGNGE